MDAEDWGELTGQIGFEIILEVATVGAAALTTLKVADKTVDAARALDKLDDFADTAKGLEKIEDGTSLPSGPIELEDVKYIKESPVKIGLFKRYIKNIENLTGLKLKPKQIEKLKEALRNKEYKKLSKIETAKHRNKFSKAKKDALIKQWEKETGQKWPRYEEDVLSKSGDPYLRAGDPYDAHHIIENGYGGEHEWWNIHPAKNPSQHQGGIHGNNAPSKELFD